MLLTHQLGRRVRVGAWFGIIVGGVSVPGVDVVLHVLFASSCPQCMSQANFTVAIVPGLSLLKVYYYAAVSVHLFGSSGSVSYFGQVCSFRLSPPFRRWFPVQQLRVRNGRVATFNHVMRFSNGTTCIPLAIGSVSLLGLVVLPVKFSPPGVLSTGSLLEGVASFYYGSHAKSPLGASVPVI